MDFRKFSKSFTEEVNGEYREYDDTQSIIILPLKRGRFQTVTGHVIDHPYYKREAIYLKSKICSLKYDIPFVDCLEQSKNYPYTKFIVEDEFLKVETVNFLVNLNETILKEMIYEMAQHADDWEQKITGKDIH